MADSAGFKSVEQQSFYDILTSQVLQLFSDRIISFARKDEFDEKTWFDSVVRIFKYMTAIEERKESEPKLSVSFKKLVNYFKVQKVS